MNQKTSKDGREEIDSGFPQKIMKGAEPFYFPGGKAACLLVHGFSSTPYDVRECGKYLAARGIASKGILLPGHSTSPKDLAQTRLPDWLNAIRESYEELSKDADHVFALGISLGGNMLVYLTQELNFKGLILAGIPVFFRHYRPFSVLYYAYRILGIRYQRKWYHGSLAPEIRKERPNYSHIPVACGKEAVRAVNWSRQILPAVRCPVLAIQSTTDHALDSRSITELKKRLGSSDVTIRWVKNRYHVVLVDRGKEEIFADIYEFISKHIPET